MFDPPLPLLAVSDRSRSRNVCRTYRLKDVLLCSNDAPISLSAGAPDRGLAGVAVASLLPPSNDLLPCAGRSKTRKDAAAAGFSTSSKAFPDDLRRANVFGSLIGMWKHTALRVCYSRVIAAATKWLPGRYRTFRFNSVSSSSKRAGSQDQAVIFRPKHSHNSPNQWQRGQNIIRAYF